MEKTDANFKHLENTKVEEYTFSVFSGSVGVSGIEDNIEFPELSNTQFETPKKKQERIKLERHFSKNTGFEISPLVKEHRGLRIQEVDEREKIINDEVIKRLTEIEEEAFNKGFEEGVLRGRTEVIQKTRDDADEKLAGLSAMISEVQNSKQKIFDKQKIEIYSLIKDLTKWIILKEMKDDGKYIERLLEKLILNIQETSNLILHVNQKDFETMPEVLEVIEKKFGDLVNVRVVVNYDIERQGLILEAQNSIIRGTMDEQMKALDKLFEPVGIFPAEEVVVDKLMLEEDDEEEEVEKEVDIDDDVNEDNEDKEDNEDNEDNEDKEDKDEE